MLRGLYATGRSVALVMIMLFALGGCGQRGPLTLPVAEPPAAGEESAPDDEAREDEAEEEENDAASE